MSSRALRAKTAMIRPAITSTAITTVMITMTRVLRDFAGGASLPRLRRWPVNDPECSSGLPTGGWLAGRVTLPYTVPCGRCRRAHSSYWPDAGDPPDVGAPGGPEIGAADWGAADWGTPPPDSDGNIAVPPDRGGPAGVVPGGGPGGALYRGGALVGAGLVGAGPAGVMPGGCPGGALYGGRPLL